MWRVQSARKIRGCACVSARDEARQRGTGPSARTRPAASVRARRRPVSQRKRAGRAPLRQAAGELAESWRGGRRCGAGDVQRMSFKVSGTAGAGGLPCAGRSRPLLQFCALSAGVG